MCYSPTRLWWRYIKTYCRRKQEKTIIKQEIYSSIYSLLQFAAQPCLGCVYPQCPAFESASCICFTRTGPMDLVVKTKQSLHNGSEFNGALTSKKMSLSQYVPL